MRLLPFLLPLLLAGQDAPETRRRQALADLLRILPPTTTTMTGRINALDRSWEDAIRRTGELPPDFERMTSLPYLPDARSVIGPGREKVRALFEHWVFGKMPPPPANLRAVVTGTRREGGVQVREVRLEFGQDRPASLRLELLIPPGKGPFPVFLINHPRNSPWVNTAVRRGYIGCTYFAADPVYGNTDDSDGFIEAYPAYDFGCLARWAWAAMRAVDYLRTLPEVNPRQIGITGHSRGGKQALLAAAFDERIGAVVASSGNTGECNPWRYTTDMFANESIEQITGSFPQWFHPRLRFFAGREHKLPVDQNQLLAMVAPRGLLMYSAYSEHEGNPFGFEQAYRSVLPVYEQLGMPGNLGLHLRAGEHATTAEDIERYVDFFDTIFGRHPYPVPRTFVLGYTFQDWLRQSDETIDPASFPERATGDFVQAWPRRRETALANVRWALGEEPAGAAYPVRRELKSSGRTSDGWLGMLYGRPLQSPGMSAVPLSFGDGLKGDLYYPVLANGRPRPGPWPVVIWLHPYSYATGYSRYARPSIAALTARGFAVVAFDQIGFGYRIHQARRFYERFPRWSLLGKMVSDTRAAIDAVSALEDVDARRIYLAGWALGAKVGLFTAALDSRVAGVAAVAGFAPLRLDTPAKGTEGLRHYSHLHGLAPRFGFFEGREKRLPVDYDEILALLAPRPVYIQAPTLDRYHPVEDVRQAVAAARVIYQKSGGADGLELATPVDFNRFPAASQERVFEWLSKVAAR